jgi:hypothetical protein
MDDVVVAQGRGQVEEGLDVQEVGDVPFVGLALGLHGQAYGEAADGYADGDIRPRENLSLCRRGDDDGWLLLSQALACP